MFTGKISHSNLCPVEQFPSESRSERRSCNMNNLKWSWTKTCRCSEHKSKTGLSKFSPQSVSIMSYQQISFCWQYSNLSQVRSTTHSHHR